MPCSERSGEAKRLFKGKLELARSQRGVARLAKSCHGIPPALKKSEGEAYTFLENRLLNQVVVHTQTIRKQSTRSVEQTLFIKCEFAEKN